MNRCGIERLAIISAIICGTAFADDSPATRTLNRYLGGSRASCTSAEEAMEVRIEASLPKLKKQGTMHGLKVISQSGQVAYRFLRFTGDKLVKTDVIARFLTAEVHPPENTANIAVTAKNYKFRYLRPADYEGTHAYVYQLRPRKKRPGLFKGELWLDAESAAPLRETGELVKSPSIFIQRVKFIRDYADRTACAPPHRTAITVQTRIAGDAEMVVWQNPVDETWRPSNEEQLEPVGSN
jgi:hypothetical protein